MSTEQNKAIARREIEQFEGQGDHSVADELLADDYRLHFPGFPPLDREGHKQAIGAFHTGFPDMTLTVELQIAEGDRVANHIRMRGTHQGDFQGIPPTGGSIDITFSNMMRLRDGQIIELWGYLDSVGLLQQLGVVSAE